MNTQAADTESLFSERYRAVQARDTRFDGQFFTAVATTGIYCRPSCPARTPRPENITFYRTAAAAHEAGYRACKRCLPEASPGTPEWNLRQDLTGRAMRLISEGAMNRGGVEELSAQLGYSSRHIHRVLLAELGAGPQSLARAQTPSPADPAQPGPSTAAQEASEEPPAPLRFELSLPFRAPFDAAGIFSFLSKRALPGVEVVRLRPDLLSYARTLSLPHGPGAVEVTAALEKPGETTAWNLSMQCELASLADVPAVVARVRRMFDLDADPLAVDGALGTDPVLAPLVRRTPGIRLPGTSDPEEYVIRAIVGQQISVPAARTHLSRLCNLLGAPYDSAIPGLTRLFPSPGRILAGVPDPADLERAGAERLDPERPLRLPRRSIRAVLAAARALQEGELHVHAGVDHQTLRARLMELPGVGRWTAAYLSLRLLGHPDEWMTGDVALLAGARKLSLLGRTATPSAAHRALETHARRWTPWRSYAAMHLWDVASASSIDQHIPRTPERAAS